MIGQRLKQYEIETLLGHGGMGSVYRARDSRLNRPVAIKVLKDELTADPDRRKRFIREAQAAAAVTHPAIAQIYDVDEAEGVTFIAMELIEGHTVRHLIGSRELDLLGSIAIAIQVGEGLAKAHEAGIVHRDIKSDNVMVTSEGHAKLLDFGLAKLVAPEPPPTDPSQLPTRAISMAETQAGVVLGTIFYMSPEQARGRPVDQRSDIFSLGVMIYEMTTGQLPFEGTSPLDTMHAIAFDETRPVTEIRPGLPFDLQRIVTRCLRKRPEDRYPDARRLVEDLRRLKTDTESGKLRALSITDRLRDRFEVLRNVRVGGLVLLGAFGVLTALLIGFLVSEKGGFGALIGWGVIGFLVWRRLRNRRERLLRRFVKKARANPGIQILALQGDNLIVLVDQAHAALYPYLHQSVEKINRRLFFGAPLTFAVRDGVEPAEMRKILQQPGVLYVRPDVLPGTGSSRAG